MQIVVVKLGGSLITEKERNEPAVRAEVLSRVGKELRDASQQQGLRCVVVHGAGAFGHVPAQRYGLAGGFRDPKQSEGIAETRASMETLNGAVVRALRACGLRAVAFQSSSAAVSDRGRIVAFNDEGLRRLLDLELVPVLYGDVVPDRTQGCAIVSGDQLAVYVAIRLHAVRVVAATDVDGVYTRDPRAPASRKLSSVTPSLLAEVRSGTGPAQDVTGGILAKVRELFALSEHGIAAEIISGLIPGHIREAVCGRSGLGTVVKEEESAGPAPQEAEA